MTEKCEMCGEDFVVEETSVNSYLKEKQKICDECTKSMASKITERKLLKKMVR